MRCAACAQPAERAQARRRSHSELRCRCASTTPLSYDFGYRRDMVDRLDLGAVIGAGAYGVVRAATDRFTGRALAVKSIPKRRPRMEASVTAGYLAKIHSEVDSHYALGAQRR